MAEHVHHHGLLPWSGQRGAGDALIELISRSGLRGRGGANFLAARKLAAVAAGRGRAVVVANGTEGEPACQKDEVLLATAPHLVLDGLAVAARAVGARRAFIATTGMLADVVLTALAERTPWGLGPAEPEVVTVPERFLSGESSALVNYLNGGPGLPTFVPPRPHEKGVGGRPTLVQNVETLAHMALIARHGAEWFSRLGPADDPGSMLVTVRGAMRRPGVYEVAKGTPLSALVARAGGPTMPVQAFLMGGYGGAWLLAAPAAHVTLSEASLAAQGATLGSGLVFALPEKACGVAETARILGYLAREGAGQCGPCAHGLPAMAAAMDDLARGVARRDVVERLESWAWQVTGRGACHHPDGAVRMMLSALRAFSADVASHRDHAACLTRGTEGHRRAAVGGGDDKQATAAQSDRL